MAARPPDPPPLEPTTGTTSMPGVAHQRGSSAIPPAGYVIYGEPPADLVASIGTWGAPGRTAQQAARRRSNRSGVPGMTLLLLGGLLTLNAETDLIGSILCLVGGTLFIYGCCYYAKAKGYSAGLGLIGVLGPLGLVGLALLPDRYQQPLQAGGNSRRMTTIVLIGMLIGAIGLVLLLLL